MVQVVAIPVVVVGYAQYLLCDLSSVQAFLRKLLSCLLQDGKDLIDILNGKIQNFNLLQKNCSDYEGICDRICDFPMLDTSSNED